MPPRSVHDGLTPGVMIEVPAAALLADRILDHVDFLSIGTNDLAQYTMAADRMSAELATLTDPWQPAVLALVAMAVRAGAAAGKPVGVCGEAAADPVLACVLTGLGVTSLSAAAAAVNGVGAKLAQVTLQQCRDAADAVLATGDRGGRPRGGACSTELNYDATPTCDHRGGSAICQLTPQGSEHGHKGSVESSFAEVNC